MSVSVDGFRDTRGRPRAPRRPARAPRAGALVRTGAVAALSAGLVVLVVVLLAAGDGPYVIHARFQEAGGLVKGGEVRVGGRKVGTISAIDLTDDNQADVTLDVGDGVAPLHRGTRANIRAVGQTGVANHYVDLSPGDRGEPSLDSGSILPLTQTTGYVSLDAILSSLDGPARASMQRFIRHSSEIYAGSGARSFNELLGKLSPALRGIDGFAGDLASDEARLGRLIDQSATAATAVASRRSDLRSAVANTAQAFKALAGERVALADSLARAPAVLRQGRGTLAAAGLAVKTLRPALRDVPAAASPLARVLRGLPPALGATKPALADLNAQIPDLRRSLEGFVRLERPAVMALDATGKALDDARPMLAGLRAYGSDFILGIFNGLVGISTGPYDASGHYVHLEFTQGPQQLFGGGASGLLSNQALVPGLFDLKSKADARCPGAAGPPSRDGSSPWVADPSLCDPADNTPASVNEP